MRKLVGIGTILALAVLLSQAAIAHPEGDEGRGPGGEGRGRGGEGHRGGPPGIVFGVLQSVSGSTWTIKPEIPPHMRERAEHKGRELPQLPDKLTVTVNEQTKFWLDGAASQASAFEAGREVVVKLDKPARDGGSTAVAVADPETAREFIMEKMREARGGGPGGEGGRRGEGRDNAGGRGGEGRERRPHLIFGTVSAVSGSSITVKPEMPDFLKDMLPGKGEKLERREGKLPESISVSLSGETRYVVNKQEQGSNPFQSGDKVAILPEGEPGSATARIVSDYASAQARMQERREKRQEKRAEKCEGKS